MKLLVTRPQPGGDATAARLRALGHGVVTAPLMVTEAVTWQPPGSAPQAIMLTSAFAARLADANAYHALPVFVVGAATARAAAAAGFRDVRACGGTVQALLEAAAAHGVMSILHLAGADRTPAPIPAALAVATRVVYRARLLPLAALPATDWVLLYSARTAAHFGAEADRLGVDRRSVAIAAISTAALAAAGPGWGSAVAAVGPDEDSLLAAIGVPCQ